MKKLFITFALFAFLLIDANKALAVFSETANNPSECSASSFLGIFGSCSIICGRGECARCNGGFFSSECKCIACQDVSTAPSTRVIPNLTPGQRTDAVEFEIWCDVQSSNSIKDLKSIVINILSAVDANNTAMYNFYEDQFRNAFISMSLTDQNLCNQWAINKGYTNTGI
jgi:hypothetical protein